MSVTAFGIRMFSKTSTADEAAAGHDATVNQPQLSFVALRAADEVKYEYTHPRMIACASLPA